jgi:hypothetical protein
VFQEEANEISRHQFSEKKEVAFFGGSTYKCCSGMILRLSDYRWKSSLRIQ